MAELAASEGTVRRRVCGVVRDVTLAGYLVVVLVITLWPAPPDATSFTWLERALAWAHRVGLPDAVDVMTVEAVANVVMFVPLGVLLPWAGRARPAVAVLLGLALSAGIELTQLALPERHPTLRDVLMNTLGAALGAAAVLAVRNRSRSRP